MPTSGSGAQNLDGMSQAYGFHTLDHHTVLLANVNEQNSEKQTRHGQDNHNILAMLAQVKAQLETISEKARHAIVQNSPGTIFDCIEKNAASKPLLAREAIKEFQEMPMSDDYDEGTKSLPNEVIFLSENTIEQQKNEDQQPIYDVDKTKGDSNVSVDVCATIPEQQPYEDTQQGSGQSPKCFSMPIFSPETPTVGIDIDQLLNCPCEASECRTWDEEYQGDDNSLWEKSVCRTATRHYISLFPWDPGATEFPVLFTTSAGATELQGTYVFKSEFTCSYETPKLLNFLVHLKKMILWPSGKFQLITPSKLFMQSLCETIPVKVTKQRHHREFHLMNEMVQNGSEFKDRQLACISLAKYLCSLYSNSLLKSGYCQMSCLWEFSVSCTSLRYPFGVPTCVLQQSCYFRVPSRQESHGTQFFWDPDILSLMEMKLGKTTVPSLFHSGQTPCKLLKFIGQPVGQNQFWAQLLRCLPWCHTPNAFLEVQYCCLTIVLDCSSSEPIQQLVCYSRIFSSTDAIMYALCMSTTCTLFMILVLSFEEIAEEGKDGVAVYQVSKVQLPIRKTTHVWNLGIDSLLLVYIWLHIHKTQLVDCTSTTTYACYFFVDACLPATQVAAYCPSNIKWEFFNQQDVQGNYSAHHLLLFSQQYLKTREIGTFFITFLPP